MHEVFKIGGVVDYAAAKRDESWPQPAQARLVEPGQTDPQILSRLFAMQAFGWWFRGLRNGPLRLAGRFEFAARIVVGCLQVFRGIGRLHNWFSFVMVEGQSIGASRHGIPEGYFMFRASFQTAACRRSVVAPCARLHQGIALPWPQPKSRKPDAHTSAGQDRSFQPASAHHASS